MVSKEDNLEIGINLAVIAIAISFLISATSLFIELSKPEWQKITKWIIAITYFILGIYLAYKVIKSKKDKMEILK